MEDVREIARDTAEMLMRQTLCLSGEPGATIHQGDDGFVAGLEATYSAIESNAAERLVLLKARLRETPEDDFWAVLTKELAVLLGAQYTLVSKRVLPDQTDAAVELPELGEPGTCFSNVAMYFNGGDKEWLSGGFEYPAHGSLCAHMRHDKVFLVPGHLADFISDRAKDFEVPVESHFAIPLVDDGRCFAHIAVFWSVEGEKARKLSWGFIEMTLHALEDLTAQRLLGQQRRVRSCNEAKLPRQSASQALAAAVHSLKPYARSLSHELRTPMHGVVGMLDIMQVTVQEALESHGAHPQLMELFRSLKENIETIQDSSRRAVEAADNIVHAYDFDMQVPGSTDEPNEATAEVAEAADDVDPLLSEPKFSNPTSSASITGLKRRRSGSLDYAHSMPSPKQRILDDPPKINDPHTAALRSIVKESSDITDAHRSLESEVLHHELESSGPSPSTPGTKLTRVREIIHVVVNESLRFGGRPDSAIATETSTGEHIEVRNRGSNGYASTKMVEWAVDPSVPDEILIDERDFAKLVSVLFLNALKFTEEGSVKLRASLSPRSRFVVVNVTDTGMGIPVAFRPYLFKAFSRGDDSLTRQNEGLGLGLMVAKGLARRVGGDLVCVRSDTEGPNRGSEFELRIPLTPTNGSSRSSTPSRTPTPLRNERSISPALAEPKTAGTELETPEMPQTKSSLPSPSLPRLTSPLREHAPPSLLPRNGSSVHATPLARNTTTTTPRRRSQAKTETFDRNLARRFPLNVMVAEDNKINRKLLVNMLGKLGYKGVHEAFDGSEAVRLMEMDSLKPPERHIDVILMDLWMPNMDGYEAAQRIMAMQRVRNGTTRCVKILAVTADVTDVALDRARAVGMQGIMTKPYKLMDLERLLVENFAQKLSV